MAEVSASEFKEFTGRRTKQPGLSKRGYVDPALRSTKNYVGVSDQDYQNYLRDRELEVAMRVPEAKDYEFSVDVPEKTRLVPRLALVGSELDVDALEDTKLAHVAAIIAAAATGVVNDGDLEVSQSVFTADGELLAMTDSLNNSGSFTPDDFNMSELLLDHGKGKNPLKTFGGVETDFQVLDVEDMEAWEKDADLSALDIAAQNDFNDLLAQLKNTVADDFIFTPDTLSE